MAAMSDIRHIAAAAAAAAAYNRFQRNLGPVFLEG